ncbi:MAG: hypothetical protein AAGF23_07805 [Acidobacteriota bacterium]
MAPTDASDHPTPPPRGLAARLGLAAASAAVTYLIAAQALWLWNHRLSSQRLSTAEEVRAYHDEGFSYGLYRYHPRRQVTLRPSHRGQRHGMQGLWMTTDARGLAFGELPDAGPTVLVLGDSVAFGSWLPYSQSLPGVLQGELPNLRVYSGATESYSLRQTADLLDEVGGPWDRILYVWVPNDFYEWRYRETPFEPYPRAALPRPLDLFDVREIFLRFTDALAGPPPGAAGDEAMAWNRRRYPGHLELLESLNGTGHLTVVLTYVRPQLDAGRFEPQDRLRRALEDRGIPVVDTRPFYEAYRREQGDPFIQESDHLHFSGDASVAWSRHLVDALGWRERP